MGNRLTAAQGEKFAHSLLAWFADAMRPLPWRKTYEPYGVWISEIMLQQTQMDRGVRYFNDWMRRFPDIESVAGADEEDVLAAWEGLGYYSRARNLHAAAKRIMREHGGVFPDSYQAIRDLPGIGDYTAGAIAAIAFNHPVPAVDANVLRIFARVLDIDAPLYDKTVKASITDTAASLIPPESPRLFNQALMELGALVCAKRPKCEICPLTELCQAHKHGTVAQRPQKKTPKRYTELEMVAAIITWKDLALVEKRPPPGLWAGLWEFPWRQLEPGETPDQGVERLLDDLLGRQRGIRTPIATVRHGYTTNRVVMHGFRYILRPGRQAATPPAAAGSWTRRDDLAALAFPAGQRKLLECLGWKGAKP